MLSSAVTYKLANGIQVDRVRTYVEPSIGYQLNWQGRRPTSSSTPARGRDGQVFENMDDIPNRNTRFVASDIVETIDRLERLLSRLTSDIPQLSFCTGPCAVPVRHVTYDCCIMRVIIR